MKRAARAGKLRKPRQPDAAAPAAATDEILQVMYWLRGENIAHEVAPNDLSKWLGSRSERLSAFSVNCSARN